MTNPDMTIRDISVTMLRMPWADDPWLKGARARGNSATS